jgi:hypothetical protein
MSRKREFAGIIDCNHHGGYRNAHQCYEALRRESRFPMILLADLRRTAREHLRAARILRRSRAYDSAVYLCGYAVEIGLKVRICKTLKWSGFPETRSEFATKASLKVHDLDALLDFTGLQIRFQQPSLRAHWTVVQLWNPEQRYRQGGFKTVFDADSMIAATSTLLKVLL